MTQKLRNEQLDAPATETKAGTMSAGDKAKLNAHHIDIRDFGVKLDDSNEYTSQIQAAWAAGVADGRKVFHPAGNVNTHLLTPPSGLRVYGVGGQQATKPSTLKLVQSATNLISFADVDVQFDGLAFNGNGLPTDAVLGFPNLVNSIKMFDCLVYGAIEATSDLVAFTGTVGGDSCIFERCTFVQNPLNATNRCRNVIRNSQNSNAFLINFNDCFFKGGARMLDVGGTGGSVNFHHCQGFFFDNEFIFIHSICQGFEVQDFYTEQTPVPFIRQVATAGATGYSEITLKRLTLNDANDIILTGQQPVVIEDSFTAGNFHYDPVATYGLYPPFSIRNTFIIGHGWIGTGADDVIRLND